jgi:hypothetical protein
MPRFNPGLDHLEREPTKDEINLWLQAADIYKRGEMRRYREKYGLENFVETGTYLGATMEAMRLSFAKVYSMELDRTYYFSALARFHEAHNVHLIYGDSAVLLPQLMLDHPELDRNTLFWLDAHAGDAIRVADPPQNYRGLVGKGMYDFSGLVELEYLMGRKLKNCVIMVDDIAQGGDGCLHGGCGCEKELMRIAPQCELEMSVGRVICP